MECDCWHSALFPAQQTKRIVEIPNSIHVFLLTVLLRICFSLTFEASEKQRCGRGALRDTHMCGFMCIRKTCLEYLLSTSLMYDSRILSQRFEWRFVFGHEWGMTHFEGKLLLAFYLAAIVKEPYFKWIIDNKLSHGWGVQGTLETTWIMIIFIVFVGNCNISIIIFLLIITMPDTPHWVNVLILLVQYKFSRLHNRCETNIASFKNSQMENQ